MKYRNLLLCAVIASSFGYNETSQAGTDAYLGEIMITPYTFCPRGSIAAEGQLLPISSYSALFSLYGTTFGGDGRTTFSMPDLKGRAIVGIGSGPGLTPRTQGQKSGVEQNTIAQANMPSHTHRTGIQTYDDPANSTSPKGNAFGVTATNTYVSNETAPSGKFMNPLSVSVDSAGASAPMNNMQPFNVLRYCVVTDGIYPSRS